jgi:O-antigen/teichoic acid export membrane protein
MSIFLTISLFIEDIVRMKFFGKQFFPPIYWQGVEIVPWVLLAYVFTGAYVVFVVGVYLEKKTKYLPFVTGAGALLNVGANFFLIPKIGILGAALSTLLSYIVMAVGMYFASQRFYRVVYEWNKVLKIAGSAAIIFIIFRLLYLQPLNSLAIVVKLAMLIAFGASMVFLKVIDSREITEIKSIVQRVFTRSSN